MNRENAGQERLFFALWPDNRVRREMTACIQGIQDIQNQGRLLNPDNLHVTLHFLGNIDAERVDCFVQQAKSIVLQPFDLSLSFTGYFKKPRVFWLGCGEVPASLSHLHAELGQKLELCGYTPESRPYNPHVTVARKITETVRDQPIEPIVWSVHDFVLVRSITHGNGVEYQVRNRFGS